jgi:hypothetical protein
MIKLYQLSTKEYEPISQGSKYLFEQYDAIFSFLKLKIENRFLDMLAKPILNEKNEIVEWHANFSKDFFLVNTFNEEKQIELKQRYWELKFEIEDLISSLSKSKNGGDIDLWIEKLTAVFNEDNNLVLSNGVDCIILWGWRFNAASSNFLETEFLPLRKGSQFTNLDESPVINSTILPTGSLLDSESNETIVDNVSDENPASNSTNQTANQDINVVLNTLENEKNNLGVDEDKPDNSKNIPVSRGLTFWERIKRFFRWISYRFWALMLLIILLLLLCCLCKNCSNKKAVHCDNCKELDSINKRLDETKSRLKENCPPK